MHADGTAWAILVIHHSACWERHNRSREAYRIFDSRLYPPLLARGADWNNLLGPCNQPEIMRVQERERERARGVCVGYVDLHHAAVPTALYWWSYTSSVLAIWQTQCVYIFWCVATLCYRCRDVVSGRPWGVRHVVVHSRVKAKASPN